MNFLVTQAVLTGCTHFRQKRLRVIEIKFHTYSPYQMNSVYENVYENANLMALLCLLQKKGVR